MIVEPIVNYQVKVRTSSITYGGKGIGTVISVFDNQDIRHLIGIKAFIPYTLSNETVVGKITNIYKHHIECDLVDVEIPSSIRIVPECKYFGKCGGCDFQHFSYLDEIDLKNQIIKEQFSNSDKSVYTKIDNLTFDLDKNYRRRVTIHLDKEGNMGFYKRSSTQIVTIDECKISSFLINNALKVLKSKINLLKNQYSKIKLESTENQIFCTLITEHELDACSNELIFEQLKNDFSGITIETKLPSQLKRQISFGENRLKLKYIDDLYLSVPPASFSQINWKVNIQLLEKFKNILNLIAPKTAIDLYSGAGNFSIIAALKNVYTTSVEIDKNLFDVGKEEARKLNIDHYLKFKNVSVENYLKNNPKKTFDLLIADPPRIGLKNIINNLPFAKHIILISCDLASCVRDINKLITKGYEVVSISPFDMFPRTTYVEIITFLKAR